jgi:hypothetical protein
MSKITNEDQIKSFCRGPGGSFFKKRPLAAGGKKKELLILPINA